MFEKIKEFLSAKLGQENEELSETMSGEPTEKDIQIATTVLLVEMASTDGDIDAQEGGVVARILSQQFSIEDHEVPDIVKAAIAAKKQEGKIDLFVKQVNENFSDVQKRRVLAMLWKVVFADGKIDRQEERLMEQMRNRLRLSEEFGDRARQMAEDGTV